MATRPQTKEGMREIQPQLFPLGLVVMATEAFSSERGTNKEWRDTGRWREGGRERENMAET